MMFFKHIVVVASLVTMANAHSALLANGKLLGQLNSGDCFNCAVGSYPVPSTIPASAVDDSDPEDGIAAYLKTTGGSVKDTWNAFHAGTPYGSIVEPDAIKPGTCGRYNPTAIGEIPPGASISYKKSNHNGPSEIYVDDTKVWSADNFIRGGGSLTADVFKCNKASCQVHWYWMGKVLVKGKWNYYQLYVQCFVIKGTGASGANETSDTTPVPATSTTKTPKPAASSDDGDVKPGTVVPPATGSDGSDSKEKRRAAKEKRRADRAAAKAAKEAAKSSNRNLRY